MAEEILKARPVCGFAREHKAAIAFDPRHLHHCGVRIGRIEVARISVLQRHPLDLAVEVIRPAMIAAGEFAGIAAFRRDHERAAMSALIVDDANALVLIADQHDRLASDPGREIVARIFHLAFVPDVDPGRAENPFKLQLEYRRVRIDAPMHAARLHEARELLRRELRHAAPRQRRSPSGRTIAPARRLPPGVWANRSFPARAAAGSWCRTPRPCRWQARRGWRSESGRCRPGSDRDGGWQTEARAACRRVGPPCPQARRRPPDP